MNSATPLVTWLATLGRASSSKGIRSGTIFTGVNIIVVIGVILS